MLVEKILYLRKGMSSAASARDIADHNANRCLKDAKKFQDEAWQHRRTFIFAKHEIRKIEFELMLSTSVCKFSKLMTKYGLMR